MIFADIKNVHLIGIGGIGMSALARYFMYLGKSVSGYDRKSTDLTKKLEEEGIKVYSKEDVQLIPEEVRISPSSLENLVIFTPAIPNNHVELEFFRERNTKLYKRAEILGEISRNYPTIGIAGTHGKTTTTSILTYICMTSEMSFASFVGGINENFKSNLVVQGEVKFVITEADEYDRSFLKLKLKHGVITSMDADHLDIYDSADKMSESFKEFASLIDEDGTLLIENKLENLIPGKHLTYGLSENADYHSFNIEYHLGHFLFDFKGPGITFKNLKLALPGYHNLENATAAIAMALKLGAKEESIKKALANYQGVKRRFEYQIDNKELIYIDDYAHHPEEIKAVLYSLRKMYPNKKITGIFQPHLFTRTRDLAEDFARSLENLDELILLEIYPAREEAIPGITSSWLLEKISLQKKSICSKEDLLKKLAEVDLEILVTLGAGDIDQLVLPIKIHLLK